MSNADAICYDIIKIQKPKSFDNANSQTNLIIYTGLEVIKLGFILKLKIKRNDWLLADTSASSQ